MTAEALQTGRTAPEHQTPLALFACILLGVTDGDPFVVAACRDARRRSTQALRSGRAPLGSESWLAYKTLYADCRERAAAVRFAPRGPAAGIMERLRALRHRQRAALTLRCMIGLSVSETAAALALRPAEAEKVLEAASTALAKAHPGDVEGGLRRAAAAVLAKPVHQERIAPVTRLPRPVVRQMLAPVFETPLPPAPVPPAPAPAQAPRRARPRIALAAAFGALIAALIVPVSAGVHEPTRPAVPVVTAVPPRTVPAARPVAAASVVVRPGDTLWAIAEGVLGDPYRWTEIWQRNRNARMPGGERFLDADLIKPGWRLILPHERARPQG
jgi:nucleoid-associated protein YgaU